jgi:CHAD domain-containing protein
VTAPELGRAPAPLRPEDTFRQAARVAMWPQVQRLLELEARLREPDATEDLKRYRVATRRLRAALRVFAGALPRRAARDVAPELRDLARAVGRVRDLDVRIGGLVDWAGARGTAAVGHVEPLRARWVEERATAAAELEPRLTGKRHARLLEDLAGLVRKPADDSGTRGRRVRDRAASVAWAAFEAVRAAASQIEGADLEALHDLRVRAKRLRYTLEFLSPVLGDDRDWLIARIVGLQDPSRGAA